MKKIYVSFTLLLLAFILVSCKGGSSDGGTTIKKFKNSDIKYDGEVIEWTKVEGSFTIIIGEDEPIDLTTNKYVYKTEDESFEVKLTIKDKKDKPHYFSRKFERLGEVKNISFDNVDSVIKWDEVKNADHYKLKINSDQHENILQNSFTNLETGSFNVKVQPIAKDTENLAFYSYYSDTYEYRKLAAPTNVVYDNINEIITWSSVPHAVSYSVFINGEALEGFQNINATRVNYTALGENFNVSIRANGAEDNTFSSALSEESKYVFLDTVDNIRVVDGVLKWDPVDNATSYDLLINGEKVNVKNPAYDKIFAGTSYRIQIKAVTNNAFHFSNYSDVKTINLLQAPTIKYDEGIIIWQQISNAYGYTAYVQYEGSQEKAIIIEGGASQFEYGFPQVGVYNIYIKATANSGDDSVYDSKISNKIKFTRLDAPANHKILENPNDNSEARIELTNVPGANGYDVKADKVSISKVGNENLVFKIGPNRDADTREGIVIKVDIKTLGKKINDNEYTLDSINERSFEINKLATPKSEITANKLRWTNVPDAKGYIIDVNGNREYVASNVIEKTLSQELSAGKHTIMIRAVSDANSKDYISSDYDTPHIVHKLSVPVRVGITNRILRWDSVDQSSNYELRYGTEDTITKTSINERDLSDIVSTTNQTIQVRALGDNQNILDSDYSPNQTFRKLASPTGLKATNSNIMFNNVSGNNGYIVEVNGESHNLTSNNISHKDIFKNAGLYNMTVKAKGDGKNVFDSDASLIVSVNKLKEINAVPSDDFRSLTWDQTNAAKSYQVTLNTDKPILLDDNKYVPSFKKAGTNKLVFVSMGDDHNTISSEPTTLTIVAKTLATPKIEASVNGRNVTITVTNKTIYQDATRWNYIAAGNEQIDKLLPEFTYENVENGSVDYRVIAQGSYFDQNGDAETFYVDSEKSEPKNITFLNSVNEKDITYSGGIIKWNDPNTTNGSKSYHLVVEFFDAEGKQIGTSIEKEVITLMLEAEKPTNATKTKVTITVLGEEGKTYDSKPTTKVFQ